MTAGMNYLAVWQPGNGAQWWVTGLSYDDFKTKDKQYFNQGLRLTCLRVRDGTFTGVWRPGRDPQWWVTGLSYEDFKAKDKVYFDQGLRLADIEVQNGRFSGVWHLGSGAQWWVTGLSYGDFKVKDKGYFDQDLRLACLRVQPGGTFTGVWHPGSGAQWWVTGLSYEDFKAKDKEYFDQGLRLFDIEIHDGKFTAVWRPGSGAQWWFFGDDYETVTNRDKSYFDGGLRLLKVFPYLTLKSSTPPWVGNMLGKDHLNGVVPPPWTPVVISAGITTTVSCWGRDYSFGDITAFPVQIRSQGRDLLRGPITLQIYLHGIKEPLTWTPATVTLNPKGNGVNASIHRTAHTTVGASTLTLTTNATVEYDGFAWFDVSLSGLPVGTAIDAINLDIPVNPDMALYTHRTLPSNDPMITTYKSYSGLVNRQNGPNALADWTETFIPFWWLGNNDVGLQWFVEDARAWPNWNSPDHVNHIYPIELQNIVTSPASNSMMLQRLRLVRNQPLPVGWKFEFGLQATPVKPLAADWRKWRPRSNRADGYNDPLGAKTAGTARVIEVGAEDPGRAWNVAFGYPELGANHAADYSAISDATHQGGGKIIQYELLTSLSTFSPQWSTFGLLWSAVPGGTCNQQGFSAGEFLCNTNPASSFTDFIVWKSNEFLVSPGADGFYHDQSVLYDMLPGWTDAANTPQPTYPVRAYRDLYRRLYTITKKGASERFLMANMSGEMNIAVLAYEDACLNGEQLRARPESQPYIERYVTGSTMLSLEEFRAEFMGRQWGIIPIFYPYSNPYGADGGVGAAATDEIMAILMLHDVALFGDFVDKGRIEAAYTSLDTFGIVDATFIPYFASPAPVQTGLPNVYGSVYKRPDGHCLIVMANFNGSDVIVNMTLNATYFPTISKVESWTSAPVATVAPINGVYQITLPGPLNALAPSPRTYKFLYLVP